MNWGAPEWGHSLWTLPVFAILIVLAVRSRAKAIAILGPLIAERVGINSRSRNRRRLILLWLALSLVLVSLAQPRWGFRWKELKQEGLHIFLILLRLVILHGKIKNVDIIVLQTERVTQFMKLPNSLKQE